MPIIDRDRRGLGMSTNLIHEAFKSWPQPDGTYKTKYMQKVIKKVEEQTNLRDKVTELIRGIKLGLDDAIAAKNEHALKALSDQLDDKALIDAVLESPTKP